MAEIILKAKLKQENVTGIRVSSAGLAAVDGDKISKNSAKAVRKLGYKFSNFKSKQLTLEMAKKATVIITMTAEHKRYLTALDNVCSISEISSCADVLDPYGQDLSAYMQTARQIESACDAIINKLKKILKGE